MWERGHPTAAATPAKFAEFPKVERKAAPFRSCQSLGVVFFPEIILPPIETEEELANETKESRDKWAWLFDEVAAANVQGVNAIGLVVKI
jgi:hypothetical protein